MLLATIVSWPAISSSLVVDALPGPCAVDKAAEEGEACTTIDYFS
jgi:hypothetical protein